MAEVMIGCKLPHGFAMELITPGQGNNPAPISKRVIIAGANSTRIDARQNPGVHKFAYTPVDEEFAAEWFKRNADLAFVRSGAVFMQKKPADAKDVGKERVKDVATGMEPLDPEKDKRIPANVKPDDINKRLAQRAA